MLRTDFEVFFLGTAIVLTLKQANNKAHDFNKATREGDLLERFGVGCKRQGKEMGLGY